MRSAAAVEPEITFIVTYRCPRCHAALEARTSDAHSWLRCPKCGRASLPPEHMRTPPRPQPLPDDVLIIGPDGTDPRRPGLAPAHAPDYAGADAASSGRRIAMAAGILVSFTMLIISFLDQNATNVGIFGVITIVLLGVAAYAGRGR